MSAVSGVSPALESQTAKPAQDIASRRNNRAFIGKRTTESTINAAGLKKITSRQNMSPRRRNQAARRGEHPAAMEKN